MAPPIFGRDIQEFKGAPPSSPFVYFLYIFLLILFQIRLYDHKTMFSSRFGLDKTKELSSVSTSNHCLMITQMNGIVSNTYDVIK